MSTITIINRTSTVAINAPRTVVTIAHRGVQGPPGPGVGGSPIPATQVVFDNTDTDIDADNVQDAIREVASATGQIDPNLLLIYTIAKET